MSAWPMLTKLKTKCFLEILGNRSSRNKITHRQEMMMEYVTELVLLNTVNRISILTILKI